MNALAKFKQRMEINRRAKEHSIPPLSEKSIQTGIDMEGVINSVCATAININLPDEVTSYARERYTSLVRALCYTLDDNVIAQNVSFKTMLDAGIHYRDCQNNSLAIFFEPKEKHIFIDKDPVTDEPMNNLRVVKYMGLFQFHDSACKLRFFRLTEELDCKIADQELNDKATVLNSIWNIEPYHLKMSPNFIDLYLRGEDFEPEINTLCDYGIPPDDFIMGMLCKLIDSLLAVLYSINQYKNYYCRLTYKATVRDIRLGKFSSLSRMQGAVTTTLPISILQMMPFEIEMLNDILPKQKPKQKPKPKRRR